MYKVKFFKTLLLLCFIGSLQAQDRISILDRKVNIECQSCTVSRILEELKKQEALKVAYSPKAVDVERIVSLKGAQVSVQAILRELFPSDAVHFKVVGKKIVIYTKTSPGKLTENSLNQIVRGTITDVGSNQPLIGASVVLKGSNPLLGASTDTYGRFKIEGVPIGRHTILFTYLGYKPGEAANITVSTGKEVVLNMALEELVTELPDVTITSEIDKSMPLNEMAMVSAKSFTVEETSRYAGSLNDPARMVTSYAGVTSGSDDTQNQIIIRGNSPKGVLWRLEGIEIPNPNHFSNEGASHGAVSMLNSNVLTNSDFFNGAFPAEYGNAFSGVFDLKLRNGNNEKREYSFKAGLLGIDASVEGPIKRKNDQHLSNASYLLNYRYSTISLLQSLGLNIANSSEAPVFQDLSFKLQIPTSKLGQLSFWGVGGSSISKNQFIEEDVDRDYTILEEVKYKMGILGLSHMKNLSDNAYLKTSTALSSVVFNYHVKVGDDQQFKDLDNENYFYRTWLVSSTFNKKFNAKHTFKAGGIYHLFFDDLQSVGYLFDSLFQSQQTLEYQLDSRVNAWMAQGFVSHKMDITDHFTITGGLHYIYLSINGQQNIEPRFGLRWQFDSRQAVSFGFGIHSRREDNSLYYTELAAPNGTISKPNINLALAKAGHFVLGYDRNFRDNFHLKAEAFYQYLYDVPVGIGKYSFFSIINDYDAYIKIPLVSQGTGENYGVELTFEKFMSKGFYFLSGASLYESKFNFDGKKYDTRFNGSYNFNLVAGKEFQIARNKTLALSAEAVLAGGNRVYPIDLAASVEERKTVYDYNTPFDRQLKDYNRFDFQVTLKLHKKKATHEIKLDIQNLTNRQNVFSERYSISQQAIVPEGYQGEIIPVLSYKVTF